jgi:hypothetical protein
VPGGTIVVDIAIETSQAETIGLLQVGNEGTASCSPTPPAKSDRKLCAFG